MMKVGANLVSLAVSHRHPAMWAVRYFEKRGYERFASPKCSSGNLTLRSFASCLLFIAEGLNMKAEG